MSASSWAAAGIEDLSRVVESCGIAGVNPIDYFADVLVRVGTKPASRVDEFVPANWARSFAPVAAEPIVLG